MKLAITDHAVQRYQERVQGAEDLEKESVRGIIQRIVDDGFKNATVRDHPLKPGNKIVPFKSGNSSLYLSLGPNKTSFPGDLAVIGVLFEKEMGKVGVGATLGDIAPKLLDIVPLAPERIPPKYVVRVGSNGLEEYNIKDDADLDDFFHRRQPRPEDVLIYELQPMQIRTQYVIERKKEAAH